jgi:hypothetical protein
MAIVATYSDVETHEAPQEKPLPHTIEWDSGPIYELLKCPACGGIMLRSYLWHSELDDDAERRRLYPTAERIPSGLPKQIQDALTVAYKVKRIDANLFGVQLGRVLELVVHEQQAEGKDLHARLGFLAKSGKIPERLATMASGLRRLRNIGAHAAPGVELTPAELPMGEALCLALLEYLYTAPQLISQVEERLQRLKQASPDLTS